MMSLNVPNFIEETVNFTPNICQIKQTWLENKTIPGWSLKQFFLFHENVKKDLIGQ